MTNNEIATWCPPQFQGFARNVRNRIKRGELPRWTSIKDPSGKRERALRKCSQSSVSLVRKLPHLFGLFPLKESWARTAPFLFKILAFFSFLRTVVTAKPGFKLSLSNRMVCTVRLHTFEYMRKVAGEYRDIYKGVKR